MVISKNMKADDQSISIITVVYNTKDFFPDYIESIYTGSIKPKEVLLYDGGSSDGTVELIKKYQKSYPEIRLFEGDNIGFAAGNNLLAEKATGHFLFLLNPDTKIDHDTLAQILKNKDKESSILMPKRFLFDGSFLHHGMGLDIFGYPTDGTIFFVDGAAIFLKRELFADLGMFDADYFMYQEDIDLSWKAHLRGIKLVTVSDAIVYHYSGGATESGGMTNNISKYTTSISKRYLGERNTLLNILKNYSFFSLLLVLPLVLLFNLLEIILFSVTLNFKFVYCYLKAYVWIFSHLGRILEKRKIVQAKRTISDSVILKKMYLGSSKIRYFLKYGIPRIK